MREIKPPNYEFCPFCGEKLKVKHDEERKRKFCPFCNWTYYPQVFSSVAGVIVKGKKVLMVKRGREPFKNTWMFPGGFIEYGEHPIKTLKREVKEETGLNLKKVRFIDVIEEGDDPRAPGNLVFFYKVTTAGGKIETDEKENKAISWFDIKHPPKIGLKSHKYILEKLDSL